jgi:PAS domain S-box-containing protein
VATGNDRRIVDSLESGLLWFDAGLRIVDANPAARTVLGLGHGALAARIDDLGWAQTDETGTPLPEDQRPVWRALHGAGETTAGIVVVHTPRRGQRWLRVRAVPVDSLGPGLGRGAVASFTDVTDERNAARSLLEREQLLRMAQANQALESAHRVAQERLERIVATAPGAVHSYCLGTEGHGRFTFASPAIRDLLGIDAGTLVARGIDLLDLVHAQDRAAVAESLRASADLGSAWLATFRVPHTAGGERCLEAHSMPVRDADGSVTWHGFLIDITERRRAEQEIRSLNVELERRVADRTSELEDKHREMEAFTYSVSHDLKAPLRGIDGYSRLLESDHAARLDEEGRFFVAMIRKATGHMGELIDDLLEYSRVERGRPVLGPVAPAPVVATVMDGAAAEAAAGAIALSASVEPALTALGEREGLVLALRNLLDNAIKFTAGRPDRAIEVGARRAPGHVLFWVHDNGPGFDMRYHDRIFEIFQRLHRAEEFPGTGVGLAIVRKAVERMHGRVWAESAKGEGATFYIQLPAAEPTANM